MPKAFFLLSSHSTDPVDVTVGIIVSVGFVATALEDCSAGGASAVSIASDSFIVTHSAESGSCPAVRGMPGNAVGGTNKDVSMVGVIEDAESKLAVVELPAFGKAGEDKSNTICSHSARGRGSQYQRLRAARLDLQSAA